MALQPDRPFRRFLQSRLGQVLIILLAFAVTFAVYTYVNFVVAIPAILLFGLAVPIWAGLKRPRYLAIVGLVVIVAVAPVANIAFTQLVRTPVGTAASGAGSVYSSGNPLMQNATVKPYIGSTNTNFTWTVTVFPGNRPPNNSTPLELDLFISTCPGATGNNSPDCSQPYPLFNLTNKTLPKVDSGSYNVTFHYRIGAVGIWAWQMGIYTENLTTNRSYFQLLIGDPTYNGIEGPVIGTFTDTYGELLSSVYFQDALFLGAPFYVVLLVYMLLKNRERRRKEAEKRAPGPIAPATGSGPTPPSAPGSPPLPSGKTGPPSGGSSAAAGGGTASAANQELNCPKCNAVVYAGESTCWKCGAKLSSPA